MTMLSDQELAEIQERFANEHGYCPNCKMNLDGDLIWDTFMERYGDEAKADETAAQYGATRNKGRWGKAISLYSLDEDRTVARKCPECDHQWERE